MERNQAGSGEEPDENDSALSSEEKMNQIVSDGEDDMNNRVYHRILQEKLKEQYNLAYERTPEM